MFDFRQKSKKIIAEKISQIYAEKASYPLCGDHTSFCWSCGEDHLHQCGQRRRIHEDRTGPAAVRQQNDPLQEGRYCGPERHQAGNQRAGVQCGAGCEGHAGR